MKQATCIHNNNNDNSHNVHDEMADEQGRAGQGRRMENGEGMLQQAHLMTARSDAHFKLTSNVAA